MIVDEALSVGDQLFQQKCERYIKEFSRNGTILMVSHDLNFVGDICDRVLWLEKGVVRDIGEPRRVIDAYRAAMRAEGESQAAGAA
jgi:homopolymeric O-antigen transport system ATP-binding protein